LRRQRTTPAGVGTAARLVVLVPARGDRDTAHDLGDATTPPTPPDSLARTRTDTVGRSSSVSARPGPRQPRQAPRRQEHRANLRSWDRRGTPPQDEPRARGTRPARRRGTTATRGSHTSGPGRRPR